MRLDQDLLALLKLACSEEIGRSTRTGNFKGLSGSKYGSLFARVYEDWNSGNIAEISRNQKWSRHVRVELLITLNLGM